MNVIFTRSDSIMSRIIRRITGEGVSHCALATPEYVIHSNMLGLHINSIEEFAETKGMSIMYSVNVPDNYELLFRKFAEHRNSKYDFGALAYLWARFLIPCLPKANLWQTSGMLLCTEWITEYINDEEDSMITPYKLYLKLSKGG